MNHDCMINGIESWTSLDILSVLVNIKIHRFLMIFITLRALNVEHIRGFVDETFYKQ